MDYKYIKDLKKIFCNLLSFLNYSREPHYTTKRINAFQYAANKLIEEHPDLKNQYDEVHQELCEVFDRNNLDTFRKLSNYGFDANYSDTFGALSLLINFNFDREHLLYLCDRALERSELFDIELSLIVDNSHFCILEDQELFKKLISLNVIIDENLVPKFSRKEYLNFKNENLCIGGKQYILENFLDDKEIMTNFFLEGENKFKSLKNTHIRTWSTPACYTKSYNEVIESILELFNYDLNLIKNTVEKEPHFMRFLSVDIKKHICSDKDFVLRAHSTFGNSLAKYLIGPLIDDKEVALHFLKTDPESLRYINPKFRGDYKFLLQLYRNPPSPEWRLDSYDYCRYGVSYLGPSVLNKKLFVEKLLEYEPGAYKYISKRLKRDEALLKKTLKFFPANIKYAAPKLRDNKNLLLPYIKMHKWPFRFISKKLQDDYELCKMAIKRYGIYIQFASKRLRGSKKLAIMAVSNSYASYDHLTLKLKNNPDVIKAAINRNIKVARFIPKQLRKNSKFWLNEITKGHLSLEQIFYACHSSIRKEQVIYEKILNIRPDLATNFSPNIIAKFNFKNFRPDAKKYIWDIYKNKTEEKDIFRLAAVKQNILGNLL